MQSATGFATFSQQWAVNEWHMKSRQHSHVYLINRNIVKLVLNTNVQQRILKTNVLFIGI